MTRSEKKVTYVHRSQFPRFFYNKKKIKLRKKSYAYLNEKKINIGPYYFFWKRSSAINKKLLKKRFCIYNGFLFHVIETEQEHGGFKLGELSTSRKSAKHKGKQRQLKKIIKKTNILKNKIKKNKFYFLNKVEKKIKEKKKKKVLQKLKKQ